MEDSKILLANFWTHLSLKTGVKGSEETKKGGENFDFCSSPPQKERNRKTDISHIGISLFSMKQGGFVVVVVVVVGLPNQHLQRCRFIYLWFWCLLGQRQNKME